MSSHCSDCPFRNQHAAVPAAPATTPAPLLAIVGETPGREEARRGTPFIGMSGELLINALADLDVSRYECHITNAALCCMRQAREVETAAKACQSRLLEELQALPASAVIVPLGGSALKSVLGRRAASILKWRGTVTRFPEGHPLEGRLMIPTVHPAFVLRAQQWLPVMRRDLRRAVDIAAAGASAWLPPEERPGVSIETVYDEGLLAERLALLDDSVAFDIETVGLGALTTSLVCLALSDTSRSIVIPWARAKDGAGCVWPNPARVAATISAALSERLTIGHNVLNFDLLVSPRYGIKAGPRVADTLVGFHSLHGELPKNLQFVCSYYFAVPPWKCQEDRHADLPRLYRYNGRDSLHTALAWRWVREELRAS